MYIYSHRGLLYIHRDLFIEAQNIFIEAYPYRGILYYIILCEMAAAACFRGVQSLTFAT